MTTKLRYSRRAGVATLVVLLSASLATPGLLWAHARLTKSEPAAKAMLAGPPKTIRLWFSEAPEIAMTRIGLTDSSGKAMPLGKAERGDTKLLVQAVAPSALPAGRYTVSWRVAAADGHPSTGSFTFSVRRTPPADAAPGTTAAMPNQPKREKGDLLSAAVAGHSPNADDASASGIAPVTTRAVEFGALLTIVGGLSFVMLILPRTAVMNDASRDVARLRSARLIAVAAVVLLVAAAARLALQSQMMSSVMQTDVSVGAVVASTRWGRMWLTQVIATAIVFVAMLSVIAVRRAGFAASIVAVIAALALAATPAMSGHAGASERWSALAVATDTLHVVAAAGWLGSLLFVLAAGIPAVDTANADARWDTVASLVNTFSPVALTFAGLVMLTGVVSATLRLGNIAALWNSGYGRVLLIKLAFLLGLLGTGAFNWLRIRPALGTERATSRLRRSAAIELAIGVLVLITTAVLVATPTPGA